MSAALKLKNYQVPVQSGERARLKVILGPDTGYAFSLTNESAIIGRGAEADIQLSDGRVSRKHARIFLHQGIWWIQDLNSQPGILSVGRWVKQARLGNLSQFGLGESLLEWVSAEAGESQLVAAPSPVEQIKKAQENFERQRQRVHSISSIRVAGGAVREDSISGVDGGRKAGLGAVFSDPKKLRLLVLVGALVGGYFYYEQYKKESLERAAAVKREELEKKKREDERKVRPSFSQLDSGTTKNLDTYFRLGFREFREGNYLRAMNYFETVLQIDPRHDLALRYKAYCLNHINGEVLEHLRVSRREEEIGRLESAKFHLQAILRLLHRNQTDPNFIQAKEGLDRLEKKFKSPEAGASSNGSALGGESGGRR